MARVPTRRPTHPVKSHQERLLIYEATQNLAPATTLETEAGRHTLEMIMVTLEQQRIRHTQKDTPL